MYMLQAETHFLTAPVPFHEHDVSVHQNIFLILILRCFYPVRYLFTLFYPLIPVSHIPAFFLIQQCRISGKIRGIVCMRHSVIDHGRADLSLLRKRDIILMRKPPDLPRKCMRTKICALCLIWNATCRRNVLRHIWILWKIFTIRKKHRRNSPYYWTLNVL